MEKGCSKFILFVEKLSEIYRFLLWEKAKVSGLSPIQIQILTYLKTNPANRRNTSSLAAFFHVTQATISESVKNLAEKGLVQTVRCQEDKRKHCITITPKGTRLLQEVCDWHNPLSQIYHQKFSEEFRNEMDYFIYSILHIFSKEFVIEGFTFCFDCKYFVPESRDKSYCAHFRKEFAPSEYPLECRHFRKKNIKL